MPEVQRAETAAIDINPDSVRFLGELYLRAGTTHSHQRYREAKHGDEGNIAVGRIMRLATGLRPVHTGITGAEDPIHGERRWRNALIGNSSRWNVLRKTKQELYLFYFQLFAE